MPSESYAQQVLPYTVALIVFLVYLYVRDVCLCVMGPLHSRQALMPLSEHHSHSCMSVM